MADEPAENIAGDQATGSVSPSADHDPETRAEAVVDRLGELYWQNAYGGRPAFESLIRTILSQNTSDKASQPAHDALMERYGIAGDLAEQLAAADREAIAETISSAGLYNQKSRVIQRAAEEILTEYGSAAAFDRFVSAEEYDTVRSRLLDMHGVGPKTADCVLLFAGGHDGVFPVDTHVHRIYRRMGIAPPDADHEQVREILEREIPPEKCGFGHTASIQFGREYCTARKPACFDGPEACPLSAYCDQVGIDTEAQTAVDPAEL